MRPAQLWWSHLRAPLGAFLVLAALLATTPADMAIARALFFDAARSEWLAAGSWWANQFLHTGGRWAVRAAVALSLALWIATYVDRDLRALRRPAAYFTIAVAISVGTVGGLKTLTNVDCPWDLKQFGGTFPFVELFADRPDGLREARCFPAAHASSGYALLALYFVLRERSALLAKLGLGSGLLAGSTFGIAQQARGAHFLSHDLWSAFIVWAIAVSIYAFAFGARLWELAGNHDRAALEDDAPAAARCVLADSDADVECGAGGLSRTTHQ